MYIDTHCHLSIEDYEDVDLVIKENLEAGVNKIIVSGCEEKIIYEAIELSKKYDCVFITIGYHPDQVDNVTDDMLNKLKELLLLPKVVGVGEIGLDYYWVKDNKEKQIELFEKQLKIAEELKKPVVIHSREATQDTINTLKKYKVIGDIHCFSGSIETAKIYISMGYKIGIGGVVTFKNSSLYKVVEAIGINNILLETDAPYLAPVPYRGKQNSSKYIPFIAKRIGEILNLEAEEIGKITSKNASQLFDLDKWLW